MKITFNNIQNGFRRALGSECRHLRVHNNITVLGEEVCLVIYNACVFMRTTTGFMGHLEQIYATEQIMLQICSF